MVVVRVARFSVFHMCAEFVIFRSSVKMDVWVFHHWKELFMYIERMVLFRTVSGVNSVVVILAAFKRVS